MHYHVFHAMPGCLPDGDVVCVDNAQSALWAWRADFRTPLDEILDDGLFLEIDTRQNLVTVADVQSSRGHSVDVGDGYLYTVERAEGERELCELFD